MAAVIKHVRQMRDDGLAGLGGQGDGRAQLVPIKSSRAISGGYQGQGLVDDCNTEDRPGGEDIGPHKQVDVPYRFQPRQAALTLRTIAITICITPRAAIFEQGAQVFQCVHSQMIAGHQRDHCIAAGFK